MNPSDLPLEDDEGPVQGPAHSRGERFLEEHAVTFEDIAHQVHEQLEKRRSDGRVLSYVLDETRKRRMAELCSNEKSLIS